LVQALGDTGHELRAEVLKARLEDGNVLLLCSDGLTEVVGDDVIRLVLGGDEDAQSMCQRLVDLALAAGGPDNITVVVARYQIPGTSSAETRVD
jgi:protein phosphatase